MDFQKLFTDHPEIIITVFSGFLLPIILVWLNSYFNIRSKEKDKLIERNFSIDSDQISHERIIHSSLVKILFEVQKLYISLSCDSIKDDDCLTNASTEFQNCFAKHQSTISDNQIFLSSNVVNELYRFYNKVAEILIELNNLKILGTPSIARVCVYDRSQELADIILNIQEIFIYKRQKLFRDLQLIRDEMKDFKTCCGPPPSDELRLEYEKVLHEIEKLPESVSFKN